MYKPCSGLLKYHYKEQNRSLITTWKELPDPDKLLRDKNKMQDYTRIHASTNARGQVIHIEKMNTAFILAFAQRNTDFF